MQSFRLNLEQQRQQAKDLLRAVRAGDAAACRRVETILDPAPDVTSFKLTDAQFVVARERGFCSWPELRGHIDAQTAARRAIDQAGPAVDRDMRTLHIRCGSDIRGELEAARFSGDFLSLWDPLTVGPVVDASDWMARRARFHGASHTDSDAMLADLIDGDIRLAASADAYERVVIWIEHDSHDQLSLIRCLGHYAATHPPSVLELISVDHFPGSRRFIGLGQLPPEAMRMLWTRREPIDAARLSLGAAAWAAVRSDDPRALAAIARDGTSSLPHLAPALHRHLQELPSSFNGLSLTQTLLLRILSSQPATLAEMWRILQSELEPLPFLGDTMFLQIVDEMARVSARVYERVVVDERQPFRDRFTLTAMGRDVLHGATDWLSLRPPVRWVGGVRIDPSASHWRWDETRQDVAGRFQEQGPERS